MSSNQYYRTGQEWAYKDVKPRLIAEKYLEETFLSKSIAIILFLIYFYAC